MLVKEYRICLPLTVAEYQVAQLYMIQKKSREESTDRSSGVEILTNKPYDDGPGGKGQYTHKIYHIGSHLPAWLCSILPSSALRVEEEAWNAYPYTRTIYKLPFMEKFTLDIETHYFDDAGDRDDVFKLSAEDKSARIVDYIDLVTDPLGRGEYKTEEDPLLYVSEVTGRGPLSPDWRTEYAHAQAVTHELHSRSPTRTIDNKPVTIGSQTEPLPKRIMCAYKLCRVEFRYWGMQRRVENFIHDIALRKTMVRAHRQVWAWQNEWYGLTIEDIRRLENETARTLAVKMSEQKTVDHSDDRNPQTTGATLEENSPDLFCRQSPSHNPDEVEGVSTGGAQIWQSLNRLASDSCSITGTSYYDPSLEPDVEDNDSDALSYVTCRSSFSGTSSSVTEAFHALDAGEDPHLVWKANPLTESGPRKLALFFVVHGGSLLDASNDFAVKHVDVETFRRTVNMVATNHYPLLHDRIAIHLVPCPTDLAKIFDLLTGLRTSPTDPTTPVETRFARDIMPLGSIPLFLVESKNSGDLINQLADRLNAQYAEFLRSPDGYNFNGPVCLVADCLGSLLTFDLLTQLSLDVDTQTDTGIRRWRKPFPFENFTSLSSPSCTETLSATINNNPVEQTTPSNSPVDPDFHTRCTHLDFCVHAFFILGSPLGLSLAYRSHQAGRPTINYLRRTVDQVYNLFHPSDFCSFRLEPLLCPNFMKLAPVSLPRYHLYPLGDGLPISLVETVVRHPEVFDITQVANAIHTYDGLSSSKTGTLIQEVADRQSANGDDKQSLPLYRQWEKVTQDTLNVLKRLRRNWWGPLRADYSVHCPLGIQSLMFHLRPTIFHASYWESNDVAAFMLRQVLECLDMPISGTTYAVDLDDQVAVCGLTKLGSSYHQFQVDNFSDRALATSTIKGNCQSLSVGIFKFFELHSKMHPKSNHRANDVIVLGTAPQVISARFVFGLLDVLPVCNEKITIQSCSFGGPWRPLSIAYTDGTGRLRLQIPDRQRFDIGLHRLSMVAERDPNHPVRLTLAVVPPDTEVVVFSIDGSFAASISIMGKDAKVRPGSVDVARHWHSLGYLLIYLSARPGMQQRRVTRWLGDHNFPQGMIYFVGGISADPLGCKMHLIDSIVKQNQLKIHCAYGSGKDVAMYRALGVPADNLFVFGRLSQSQAVHATRLEKSYSKHLVKLLNGHPAFRQAAGLLGTSLRCSTLAYSPLA